DRKGQPYYRRTGLGSGFVALQGRSLVVAYWHQLKQPWPAPDRQVDRKDTRRGLGRATGGPWPAPDRQVDRKTYMNILYKLLLPRGPRPTAWLTARVNPTIRRISPPSSWRRSAGLAPALGWCGQPP